MLPFSFRADIWSYLPLAKLHCFCNFRDNLCSNEWISMKLCSCKSLSAWMVLFSFWPDICSYLPLAKFHEFCNFRDNLSSDGWNSMKLCSCNDLCHESTLLALDPISAVTCPLRNFTDSASLAISRVPWNAFQWNFICTNPLGHECALSGLSLYL